MEEGGVATGLYSSASSLGTLGDTNRTFGPGEHGVREEKQSHLRRLQKKQHPWV